MQLSALILILLPVVTPLIGSSVAAILSQRGWPAWVNDSLAWFCLLAFAGLDLWANGQFAGGWLTVVGDGVDTLTLLASGWLVKLDPWLAWLTWLQSNVFDLVPLLSGMETKPPPANAYPVRVPTALTLPQGASPVPPRASAGQEPPKQA